MKLLLKAGMLTPLLLLCASPLTNARVPAPAPKKHALLIAVQGYGEGNDWWKLNTNPDVEKIAEVLRSEKYGFTGKTGDIVLKNKKAETTHEAIIKAFKDLIAETQPGDVVYVHYSGHGSQADDSKDYMYHGQHYHKKIGYRKNVDGKDRTLVPSDAVGTKDPSNDIFGEELDALLTELKAKHPGSITLTFDCCHAGDNTRGGPRPRGDSRSVQHIPISEKPVTRGTPPQTDGLSKSDDYVAISACRSDQVANEFEGMGAFSWALVESLKQIQGEVNYADLFNKISSYMADHFHEQQPVMEGNATTAVLGTKKIPNQTALTVTYRKDDSTGNDTPALNAGTLVGVGQGTEVDLFAAGTDIRQKDKRLTTATVTGPVDPLYAPLKITGKKVDKEALRGAKAVITKKVYAAVPLIVNIAALNGHPHKADILAKMQELVESKMITLTEKADQSVNLWIAAPTPRGGTPPAANGLQVLDTGQHPLLVNYGTDRQPEFHDVLDDNEDLPDKIVKIIRGESKRQLFNALKSDDPNGFLRVKVELIPIEVKRDEAGHPIDSAGQPLPKDGEAIFDHDKYPAGKIPQPLEMAKDTYFRIQVTNTGDGEIWVNVFDLSSDGGIQPIWPSRYYSADTHFAPGQVRTILHRSDNKTVCFQVGDPIGKDVIKILAAPEKFDVTGLIGADGDTRGNSSPLAQLFGRSTSGSRGVNLPPVEPTQMAVGEAQFITTELPKP